MRNARQFYVPNAIVFVTLVAGSRRTIFDLENPDHAKMFLNKMQKVSKYKPCRILAYTLLPDHVHLLIHLTGKAQCSAIMQSVLRSFTFEYKGIYAIGESVNLWQDDHWEHTIHDEQDLDLHFDHIHWNAIQHELVKKPEDWPYSSYLQWVEQGHYEIGWGYTEPESLRGRETDFGEPNS